ncbi:hypothetical protein Tsubulata_040716 [Turnera subulata]|uniref:Uncharacterized protein n=1 Tax=Turnera subulata TaxID=218843 RepID=A0A9Q0JM48_9ROSI|nr:hypothetical protein Tsubulata_040716 [Turnera subulata]
MEDTFNNSNLENIFQRQIEVAAAKNSRNKIRKPPTRLQNQAPPCLEIDHIIRSSNPFNKAAASSPLTPIPLLSPLVVSPREGVEEFRFPVVFNNNNHAAAEKGETPDPNNNHNNNTNSNMMQHPALTGIYMEPSALFSLFQSKCVLVNHAQ